MAFHFLLFFVFLHVAIAGSPGALPEEVYWNSVFPNSPMPKALRDLLLPTVPSDDATQYNHEQRSRSSEPQDDPYSLYQYPFINYRDGHEESKIAKAQNDPNIVQYPFIDYREGGEESKIANTQDSAPIKESQSPNGGGLTYINPPMNVSGAQSKEFKGNKNSLGGKHGIKTDPNPNKEFGFHSAAEINETLYLLERDLHPGKMLKLPLLIKARGNAMFLPYRLAMSMPFSSDKLPEILKLYSIEADSWEATAMNETIRNCERSSIDGQEEKYCATSLKSFVDMGVSKLGRNIQLLANEVGKETNSSLFIVGKGVQYMGEKEIVCHRMQYPYAVFLCHSINRTAVFKVPLFGIDGNKKANALAVCHRDTSAWDPNHPSFKILKVKPGTVPVCHFLVRDTLIWVSN